MYRRQEASGIPHLLVAPKSGPRLPPPPPRQPHRAAGEEEGGVEDDDDDEPIDRSIYTDGHGDARGYYYDGAYTAAPDPETPAAAPDLGTNNTEDGGDAPELVAAAYFASLCDQFARLRTHLHTPPPPSPILLRPDDDENENENNKTQYPVHVVDPFGPSSRTFSVWTTRLRTTDPRPAQLARMDKHSVFRLLRVLLSGGGGGGGKQAFLRSGAVVTERTSRWVWALLARLPDRGELDHVETAHVRELGKRAALLMHGLRQMARLQEEVALGGGGGGQGDEGFWGGDDDDDDDDDHPPAETTTKRTTGPHDDNNNNHEPPADGASAAEDTRGDIPNAQQDDEREDGEIDNSSSSEEGSAPMDMDHEEEDVDAARARLLARLDAVPSSPPSSPPRQKEGEREREQEKTETFDPVRARMNMRATLTMILTVAGEFYGQRDLLQFRDPFRGL